MASPSPSRDGDRVTPVVGSAPAENQYLRFDLQELGDQFGVRAGDLVRALAAHRDEHSSHHADSDVEAVPSAPLGTEVASGSYASEGYLGQGLVMTIVGAGHQVPIEQGKTLRSICDMDRFIALDHQQLFIMLRSEVFSSRLIRQAANSYCRP